MKVRQRLPQFRQFLQQKGQTLVEFVLLLAVISLISYGFVSIMNRNIGGYWEHCVNLIIHDKPGEKTAKIE
jgi:Flp pilus assembly pilin Flp